MPLALWLAATLAGVQLNADHALTLDTQPLISSRLFGLTAFEGFTAAVADPDYAARIAAIRPGCVRFSGSVAWYAPAEGQPLDAGIFGQTLLFGNRYPTGRFLPLCRRLGAEPMISLGGPPAWLKQPGTEHPSDLAKWADYCVQLVGLCRQADPSLRLVQIWNEPNASWFRDPRAGKDGGALHHIELANTVAKALKAKFPDLMLGGPVLCWPPAWPANQQGQKPWYTWDQWTRPWLERTKDTIDFFDFHVYDVAPDDLAVQIEMLSNEAERIQGRRLPIWITESNVSLTDQELDDPRAVFTKRVLPYERLLLRAILPQADKVAGNLYHDLHARSWALLRDAARPEPTWWLLWILRDLRGTRLAVSNDLPNVDTLATIEDDRVTVVVFNDQGEPREVPLDIALPGGWWTGPEARAIGPTADGCGLVPANVKIERQGGRATGSVSLPAWGTASISFRLTSFRQPARRTVRREWFGDATRAYLTAGQPVTTTIAVPTPPTTARLRVGLLGTTGAEPLTASFNGRPLKLRATAFQEIELPAGSVVASNKLELATTAGDNPRLALAFAAVVGE